MINFKKDIMPHLVAVATFLLLSIVFFHPLFFENKELEQHDVIQGIGGAKELIDYRAETGEEGLWTNSMFSGMPAYLINVQWSGDLLRYVHKMATFGLKSPARHVFLAMISFYILLLSFKVRPYLSIAGAIAFGMSSFVIIGLSAGHVWRIVGMAWMPMVIAGVHLSFHDRKWLGLGLTALGLGLQIRSNHMQMTYYLLIIILIYGLFQLIRAIRQKQFPTFAKNVLLLLIPVVLAVASNFGKIWTIIEYSKYSIRGKTELTGKTTNNDGLDKAYAFQYSNGIFEPLMLLIPNIMGGASQQKLDKSSHLSKALERNGLRGKQLDDQLRAVPTYWGDLPLTAPYYAGILVFFLFAASMFATSPTIRNWGLTLFVLSIVLSWGSNFQILNYFLFDHLPGYNKFRSVTFTITVAFIILPLLGFVGLEEMLRNKGQAKYLNYARNAFYLTGGILVLALLYSWMGSFRGAIDERLGNLPEWYLDAIRLDRARILRMDVLRNIGFLLALVFVLWRFWKNKMNSLWLYIAVILLVTLDISLVSSRFISDDNYVRDRKGEVLSATPADQRITSDPELHYRVLNLQNPFNEARTSYFHHSIGGYHGAKIRRYQDMIELHISSEISTFIQNYQQGRSVYKDLPVLNMLNAKYFYAGSDVQGVFENPQVMGNAWFVKGIIEVDSPDQEIKMTGTVAPDSLAVIDISKFKVPEFELTGSENFVIELLEYRPNYLKYESRTDGPGLALFSEIYYPEGWSATINGQPAEILRANYILRAMEVPQGINTIEFVFEPDSYFIGNKITMLGSLLTLLGFFLGVLIDMRSRTKKEEKNT